MTTFILQANEIFNITVRYLPFQMIVYRSKEREREREKMLLTRYVEIRSEIYIFHSLLSFIITLNEHQTRTSL